MSTLCLLLFSYGFWFIQNYNGKKLLRWMCVVSNAGPTLVHCSGDSPAPAKTLAFRFPPNVKTRVGQKVDKTYNVCPTTARSWVQSPRGASSSKVGHAASLLGTQHHSASEVGLGGLNANAADLLLVTSPSAQVRGDCCFTSFLFFRPELNTHCILRKQ